MWWKDAGVMDRCEGWNSAVIIQIWSDPWLCKWDAHPRIVDIECKENRINMHRECAISKMPRSLLNEKELYYLPCFKNSKFLSMESFDFTREMVRITSLNIISKSFMNLNPKLFFYSFCVMPFLLHGKLFILWQRHSIDHYISDICFEDTGECAITNNFF